MNLVLLGGISVKNRAWIEQVQEELKSDFETQILYYDHWQNGGEEMDFAREGEKLVTMCEKLANYAIFAKSGGSWLTLRLAAEGRIAPVKVILVGPAWNWARNNGFDPGQLVSKISVPVLVVDKTADPSLPFAQLKSEVAVLGLNNFKLVEVPGDTHHYEDVVALARETREFLAA